MHESTKIAAVSCVPAANKLSRHRKLLNLAWKQPNFRHSNYMLARASLRNLGGSPLTGPGCVLCGLCAVLTVSGVKSVEYLYGE